MRTRHWLAAASAAAVVAVAGCADQPYYNGEPGPGLAAAPGPGHTGDEWHGDRYYGDRYYPAASRYSDDGRIVAIDVVQDSGHATGGGALLGGIAGGVLGHQIGSGRGNTAATVAGAVGGAVVGNEVEKRHSRGDYFRVTVQFRDGHEETYTQDTIGDLHVGDYVHLEGGRLYRD
jgi:outer membrane lipoprotein SlyB